MVWFWVVLRHHVRHAEADPVVIDLQVKVVRLLLYLLLGSTECLLGVQLVRLAQLAALKH
jgi:hypothetical protein